MNKQTLFVFAVHCQTDKETDPSYMSLFALYEMPSPQKFLYLSPLLEAVQVNNKAKKEMIIHLIKQGAR